MNLLYSTSNCVTLPLTQLLSVHLFLCYASVLQKINTHFFVAQCGLILKKIICIFSKYYIYAPHCCHFSVSNHQKLAATSKKIQQWLSVLHCFFLFDQLSGSFNQSLVKFDILTLISLQNFSKFSQHSTKKILWLSSHFHFVYCTLNYCTLHSITTRALQD